LLRDNPRALNFDLACAAVLQRFDVELDQARLKFDLERDEAQRKFLAALWGVELKESPTKTPKASSANGRKQTMTRQDIMRNYAK
jgi:hypothetical protein